MPAYRFIIVDDHPLFRDALRESLSMAFDCVIDEAGSLDELSTLLQSNRAVDLVLLDLSMPGVQGLSGLLFLRAQFPEIPVVVCSASEEASTIRRCIEFGASGFIAKSQPAEAIRQAVAKVLGGEVYIPSGTDLNAGNDEETSELSARLTTLTPQQLRVLMMLGEGLLNKQIAYKLSVSEATIKAHVSAILQKLGVDSRTQAVIAINKIDDGAWRQTATR
jgi:DNA-binding NarL/FixJ family response regulator